MSGVAHIALLGQTKPDEVTVNVNVLLVPFVLATDMLYVPGVLSTVAYVGHILPAEQFGPTLEGIDMVKVLPSEDVYCPKEPVPKSTVFPVEVKPVPVMVTTVPTGPDVGESAVMTGDTLVDEEGVFVEEVTVNVTTLLVPLSFVTNTLYVPGAVCTIAYGQRTVAKLHAGV